MKSTESEPMVLSPHRTIEEKLKEKEVYVRVKEKEGRQKERER